MVHYIHYRDPNSSEIEKELEKIPKCPGTCFFIDVINSTDIKYKSELKDWGKRLNNTFNFISFLNDLPENEYVLEDLAPGAGMQPSIT